MTTTTNPKALRAAAAASSKAIDARKAELATARQKLEKAQSAVKSAQAALEHATRVWQVNVERADTAERAEKQRGDAARYHATSLGSMLADRLTPEQRAIAAARKAAGAA
jgi:hypothetical protein